MATYKEFTTKDCSGTPKATEELPLGCNLPTAALHKHVRAPLGLTDAPAPIVIRCPAA
jgi:hypothetical protein